MNNDQPAQDPERDPMDAESSGDVEQETIAAEDHAVEPSEAGESEGHEEAETDADLGVSEPEPTIVIAGDDDYVPPPPPPPPPPGEVSMTDGEDNDRNTLIVAVVIVVVAACVCAMMMFAAGFGLFSGEDSPRETSTPVSMFTPLATATPRPQDTPVPTDTPSPTFTPAPNVPPQAVIDAPTRAQVDEELLFRGTDSRPGDAEIVDYRWDFNDGTGARGPEVTHVYRQSGTYVVTLNVVDGNNLTDETRIQIRVSEPEATPLPPEPPTAVIRSSAEGEIEQPVSFDGRDSTGANPIVNYAWNFGDRTQGSGAVVEHVYRQAGTYEVTLVVTDNQGLTGSTVTSITINDRPAVPPSAVIEGPDQAFVKESVTFSAAVSQPGSSTITNYAWDFGNGQTVEGGRQVAPSVTYTEPGQYRVLLSVTNDDGLSDDTSRTVVIHATLQNTVWALASAAPGTTVTIQFSGPGVAGFAGCNEYTGTYSPADTGELSGAMTFSEFQISQKICDEVVNSQESLYLKSLAVVSSYSLAGDTLTLSYPNGRLVFQPAARE